MSYFFKIMWISCSSFFDLVLKPLLIQVLTYNYNQALSLLVRLPFLKRLQLYNHSYTMEDVLFVVSFKGEESFHSIYVRAFFLSDVSKELNASLLGHFGFHSI